MTLARKLSEANPGDAFLCGTISEVFFQSLCAIIPHVCRVVCEDFILYLCVNIFPPMSHICNDAFTGCRIAVPRSGIDPDANEYPIWTFGVQRINSFGADIPDIVLDPDDGVVTLMNVSEISKTYYVTISKAPRVLSSKGEDFLRNPETTSQREYVTFIALVHGGFSLGLCQLAPEAASKKKRLSKSELSAVCISSDIQDYTPTGQSGDHLDLDVFPLQQSSVDESFLCTQSSGGALTHFAHPSTFYAVDFRCRQGTPVVSVFDCEVVEIRNEATNSGVRVEDLFSWNSVMIKSVDADVYCEYVHVRKDSFRVSVGDRVKKGEIICESGEAGFCPEPHLHFEVHRDCIPGSPSIPILWKGSPIEAGKSYP